MSIIEGVDRDRIAAVRAFNRRWTEIVGLLDAGLLETPYTLTEARVLYELAQRDDGTVDQRDLRDRLALDASYLSRTVARLRDAGVVATRPSPDDGRRVLVALTASGRDAAADLSARSDAQVAAILGRLGEADQQRLASAMTAIEHLMAGATGRGPADAVTLRGPRPGDLGWVVQANGASYAAEYGWDRTYEALVARIVADYVDHHRPGREAAWIAELDGEPVGCVFCVEKDAATAQLRLLLVDPRARGMGVGRRLVEECVAFARRAGYGRLVLWTNDVLVAARHIYVGVGFELVGEEPHHSFGHDLVGQDWQLDLTA